MRNELVFSTLVLGLLIASPISAADEPVARVPVEEHPADSEARALLDAIRAGGKGSHCWLRSGLSSAVF